MILAIHDDDWRVLESLAHDQGRRMYLGDLVELELANYQDHELVALVSEPRTVGGAQRCLKLSPIAEHNFRLRAERAGMKRAALARVIINRMRGA